MTSGVPVSATAIIRTECVDARAGVSAEEATEAFIDVCNAMHGNGHLNLRAIPRTQMQNARLFIWSIHCDQLVSCDLVSCDLVCGQGRAKGMWNWGY